MASTMITVETVTVWTCLAFALWLATTMMLTKTGLKGAAAMAALLSWLVARVIMTGLPMLLDWISRYSRA